MNPLTNQIEIYPNPTSNSLKITSSLEINSLQITDIIGSVLMSKSDIYAKEMAADLNTYKEGVYFVKVCTEAGSETVRIVKQ